MTYTRADGKTVEWTPVYKITEIRTTSEHMSVMNKLMDLLDEKFDDLGDAIDEVMVDIKMGWIESCFIIDDVTGEIVRSYKNASTDPVYVAESYEF